MFSFPQGILHSALHNQYWRLIDPQGKPSGVMGWWPSRAVTFLENHDTGSTQVSHSLSHAQCERELHRLTISAIQFVLVTHLRGFI